jgi:hypothetical protein
MNFKYCDNLFTFMFLYMLNNLYNLKIDKNNTNLKYN